MSHLAALGGHGVNGVSQVHSELLKKTILPEYFDLYPERFFNVTSGVTQRRWLVLSNPQAYGTYHGYDRRPLDQATGRNQTARTLCRRSCIYSKVEAG